MTLEYADDATSAFCVNRRKKIEEYVLQFKYFVYICNVIVHGTNESTERKAPRVEVVTLNYILITINLCSFKPCNSWQSGQGKGLEYGDTRLLGREMVENEMEGMIDNWPYGKL